MPAPCSTTWVHSAAQQPQQRFEVDGANAARLLRSFGISQAEIDTVWTATSPHHARDSQHMHPVVALLPRVSKWTSWGWPIRNTTIWSGGGREPIPAPSISGRHHPAFYDGIKHKPDTTFSNVKADVIATRSRFRRGNFCSVSAGPPGGISGAWGYPAAIAAVVSTRICLGMTMKVGYGPAPWAPVWQKVSAGRP